MVHGGVRISRPRPGGRSRDGEIVDKLMDVAERARRVLLAGSALDAVEEAVRIMEEDPTFNAGYGSALNLVGEVEVDASIMDGSTMRAGAVGAVRGVLHPVTLARAVMERTPHVLLVGEGAREFARKLGLGGDEDLVHESRVSARREALRGALGGGSAGGTMPARDLIGIYGVGETVGAVALDGEGRLAAATSTGGLTLKLPGRVGDSAVVGAGTYADGRAACSGTGVGEAAIVEAGAFRVVEAVGRGLHPRRAAEEVLDIIRRETGREFGFIVVDRSGRVGVAQMGYGLFWASATDEGVEGGIEGGG